MRRGGAEVQDKFRRDCGASSSTICLRLDNVLEGYLDLPWRMPASRRLSSAVSAAICFIAKFRIDHFPCPLYKTGVVVSAGLKMR